MYIDPLFNIYKVKFIILEKLFKKLELKDIDKNKTKIESVNIFINLESVFMTLHRDYVEEELRSMDKRNLKEAYINIISNIINLSAHYRLFFNKRKVKTNIYYYFNDIDCYYKYNNCSYVDNYREYYNKKFDTLKFKTLNNLIREGIEFSNTIIDYLQRIYFVSSDRLESSCIPYYFIKENKSPANMNIIISKDLYDLQYVNKKCLIIYPYQDNSEIITKVNVMDFLKEKYKYDNEFELSPLLLPFIIAVLGDKKRGLDKIRGVGFKKLYKGLCKLYKDGFIDDNEPNSLKIENISSLIRDNGGLFQNDIKETIMRNYQCIDLDRQLNIAHKISLENLTDNLIDKIDNISLKEINDKYFHSYPLQLEELNIYNLNKKKNIFNDL